MSEARDGLPAGWQWATLGDLVDRLQYGYTASATAGAGGPRFLRITDLQEGGINWGDVPGCVATGDDIKKYELRDGDVVFARTGSIEKAAVVRSPPQAVFASYLIRGRPVHPGLSNWIGHFVRSRHYLDQVGAAGAGIGRQNVNATKLGAVRIPVAPEAEQRRIVRKLDELLASSRAAEAALDAVPALLVKYGQSVLMAAFQGDLTADWRDAHPDLASPWRECAWREVGRCQNGRAFPSNEYSSTGIPLLRPGNLHVSGRVEWTAANTRHMSLAWAERFPKHVVGPGEIVMNLTAQSLKDEFLGRVCMTSDGDSCLLNQRVARLTPTEVAPRYAFWLLKSPLFRRYVDGLNTGSLIQHMFTSQVDDFVLPVPSAAEQTEIVRRLEALLGRRDALTAALREARERIKPLEEASLAKAFRGELVPQDPADEPAAAALARLSAGGTTGLNSRRRSRASHRA